MLEPCSPLLTVTISSGTCMHAGHFSLAVTCHQPFQGVRSANPSNSSELLSSQPFQHLMTIPLYEHRIRKTTCFQEICRVAGTCKPVAERAEAMQFSQQNANVCGRMESNLHATMSDTSMNPPLQHVKLAITRRMAAVRCMDLHVSTFSSSSSCITMRVVSAIGNNYYSRQLDFSHNTRHVECPCTSCSAPSLSWHCQKNCRCHV